MTVFRPTMLDAVCSTCRRERWCAVVACVVCFRHIAACEECGGVREVVRALGRHVCDEEVGK